MIELLVNFCIGIVIGFLVYEFYKKHKECKSYIAVIKELTNVKNNAGVALKPSHILDKIPFGYVISREYGEPSYITVYHVPNGTPEENSEYYDHFRCSSRPHIICEKIFDTVKEAGDFVLEHEEEILLMHPSFKLSNWIIDYKTRLKVNKILNPKNGE